MSRNASPEGGELQQEAKQARNLSGIPRKKGKSPHRRQSQQKSSENYLVKNDEASTGGKKQHMRGEREKMLFMEAFNIDFLVERTCKFKFLE
ncbi:MAG: hypothetical protein K5678_05590 [Acetatifactor sp.]|nr:hypothetical protein [Acetatifactor sp.]